MKTAIKEKLKRYKYENAQCPQPLNSQSVTSTLNLEFESLLNSANEHIERYGDASELSLDSLKLDISSTQKDNVPTEMPCKMTSDEHITNNTLSALLP
jgi:hypothetical protein